MNYYHKFGSLVFIEDPSALPCFDIVIVISGFTLCCAHFGYSATLALDSLGVT